MHQAIAGLGPGLLNRHLAGEDWSIRDVLVHLADSELVGAVRFRLVLADDEPLLPVYDQDAWKRRLHYLWRDPQAAIALFQQTRFATAEILQQCDAAAWRRSGIHPERGPVTLEELLGIYVEHVDGHISQVERLRFG